MDDFLDFVNFIEESFITVKGHLDISQFKQEAEDYLNLDEEKKVYLVDNIRHLYGKIAIGEDGVELWNWGFSEDEDSVVPVTVGEYFPLDLEEDGNIVEYIIWDSFISNN